MLESVNELVDASLIAKSKEAFEHPSKFRIALYKIFLEKDEVFKELFNRVVWVQFEEVAELEDGSIVSRPVYDNYLESVFDDAMEEFCETNQSIIKKVVELMKDDEKFHLAAYNMEIFYTDKEWEDAKKKSKVLLKEYAKKNGFSMIKATLQIPSFSDPNDLVEWLEVELDK